MKTHTLTFNFPSEVQELINGKTLSHIAQEIQFQIIVNGEDKKGNIVGELMYHYGILEQHLRSEIYKLEEEIIKLENRGLTYGNPTILKLRKQIEPHKTEIVHAWLIGLHNDYKSRVCINKKIPHSLFNVICNLPNFPFNNHGTNKDYQNFDTYYLFNALSERFGYWDNGGKIRY